MKNEVNKLYIVLLGYFKVQSLHHISDNNNLLQAYPVTQLS